MVAFLNLSLDFEFFKMNVNSFPSFNCDYINFYLCNKNILSKIFSFLHNNYDNLEANFVIPILVSLTFLFSTSTLIPKSIK